MHHEWDGYVELKYHLSLFILHNLKSYIHVESSSQCPTATSGLRGDPWREDDIESSKLKINFVKYLEYS